MARVSAKSIERYATTLAEKERRGKKLTPREKEVLDLRDARALLWEVDDAMRHNIYPNELYDRIRQHLEGHDE